MNSAELAPLALVNAILAPSGDHAGCAAGRDRGVTCRIAPLSRRMTAIRDVFARASTNAIRPPSGDHAGDDASARLPLRRRRPLPSEPMT